jgi:hypothetical protein
MEASWITNQKVSEQRAKKFAGAHNLDWLKGEPSRWDRRLGRL